MICMNTADQSLEHWRRRDFLKASAATVLGLAFSQLPAMAGPFTREDFDHMVPADKKLSPDWVKSLFARGTPEMLRGGELKYVGMPVGGIGAGQLYLGGDGRLWHWDIFNQGINSGTSGPHYAKPLVPASPLAQKFSVKIGEKTFSLDHDGFSDVSFRGEYPVGSVEYAATGVPVVVKLEAFSPFIPLNTDDSSLPATILQFTVRNTSAAPVEATLAGELENGVCLNHRQQNATLRNRVVRESGVTALLFSAEKEKGAASATSRTNVIFEDWNKETYESWTVEGTAFGRGPIKKSDIPSYQGNVGGDTARVVNSHATAPGNSETAKDNATGKLVSRDFTIERNFITFWIGGGKAKNNSHLGLTLVVAGQPVQTATGQNKNEMAFQHFDVRAYAGKTAHLEIIDDAVGGWGNTGVGKIVFTDQLGQAETIEE